MAGDDEQLEVPEYLSEGPIRERSCTDVACLIFFVLFWGLCLLVLANGLKTGDLSKIARPYDSDGNACGYVNIDVDLAEYKYLYFDVSISMTGKVTSNNICSKNCPDDSSQSLECSPTKQITSCSNITPYSGFIFMKRFCVPNKQELLTVVGALFSGFNAESMIESVIVNKNMFLYALALAFILSYLYSCVLHRCTWLVVVVTIISIFVIGIYVSIASWKHYQTLKSQKEASSSSPTEDQMVSYASFYKWTAVLIWATLAVLLISIILLFSRIKLAVNVIMAAGDFVSDSTGIVMIPVIMVFLSIAYITFWCYGLAIIFSTGELYYNPSYPWGKFKWDDRLKYPPL